MRRDLILVGTAAAAAVACALSSAPTAITALLGMPVLLLAPGYVWLAALLPAGAGARPLERGVLSVGLSLALLVVGGLLLQVTGAPLDRVGFSGLVAAVVAAGALVAGRRGRPVALRLPSLRPTRAGVLLTVAGLILAGAVATAVIGARTASPTRYTSLSLDVTSADSAELHVHNAEGSARRYQLVLTTATGDEQRWTVPLAAGDSWSRQVDGRPGTLAELYLLDADGMPGSVYRSVAIRTSGAGR